MSIQYNIYSRDRDIIKMALSSVQARRELLIKAGMFGSVAEKELSQVARSLVMAIDKLNELELKSMHTKKYANCKDEYEYNYPNGEGVISYV